ncbi:ABC transporter permease [Mesorhizobium sp. M2C.T.Ca.TU.002.02.1.1]|uniref:ABC transporter permease n=1 Tax=Mesorhizobium sp. M2C.T.Ca.TU.002.02.1.1 TaxID=2496788 RepID=UPI000FCC8D3F|nr:ABC transporter permease [Mesorhizobium sp. M2C.T.Ca.TU.002.02.1.1]RUU60945.1 ABC transporter permease [Mesorhizobium sp. M2C.T.Ca.TU.002.02.1.1]RUU69312.1 ABC transporter permease [Mesorhizobium sp. M2C.T.Ca.TU.009.01.2.1]
MAERSAGKGARAVLKIEDLQVFYGESHALQGISLTLESGVLSVVGRNGMGKSTLCNTIVGLKRARSGSIRFDGREITALEPHEIHRLGVGYVPQGRRVWPSLTVDEHLRLASGSRRDAAWTVERVYQTFPRLAERRHNGGSQLSGGEQQMLAISRALLSDPKLLVMDEPTEGLAPIIVDQVEKMLVDLAAEGEMAVLVIEQNIGVATAVSSQVAIMVNGRINRLMEAAALAADRDLQQRLLGVGRHAEEAPVTPAEAAQAKEQLAAVYRVDRAAVGSAEPAVHDGVYRPVTQLPNRWNVPVTELRQAAVDKAAPQDDPRKVFAVPFAERIGKTVLVVGTFDTKGKELRFVADRLKSLGLPVRTVDLSTSGKPSSADVPAMQVAGMHIRGSSAVFTDDRGGSVSAMAEAFARWIEREPRIGGIISAGGSGGTTLATAGMRVLPVGIPKLMVSTVAAGDVAKYVGGADIMMFHSVADVQGLNSITEQVLSNAAHAMAGMVAQLPNAEAWEAKRKLARPAVGITMFGVTTPAVQAVTKRLEADYDCLVFHATGIGGRAMENLGDSRLLSAFLDLTTTEVADMIVGGVFPATEDRFGAAIRSGLPYVGSTGALDMVNFGPRDSVPEKFRGRKFVIHNPNVTLMRTTRDENRAFGEWIGARLNAMNGPVRFLLPEGGVSMLDAPGQPFHDPEADNALFEAIEKTVRPTPLRHVERVRANINDTPFVDAVIGAFNAIGPKLQRRA